MRSPSRRASRLTDQKTANLKAERDANSGAKRTALNSGAPWVATLEQFLPDELRGSLYRGSGAPRSSLIELVAALQAAREEVGRGTFSQLARMVNKDARGEAVLYIVDQIVQSQLSVLRKQSVGSPSNVTWPGNSLVTTFSTVPIEVMKPIKSTGTTARLDGLPEVDASPQRHAAHAAMAEVWLCLGNLIINSESQTADQSRVSMSVMQRVLARLHHHEVIPKEIYAYSQPLHSSIIQRPPLLHLLSSRILTALSDAVWRSQQDDLHRKAAAQDRSVENVATDPPERRFRLKTREIGREVWLEFILWCCVESGHATVGARLIHRLKQRTDQPWFAISWTSNSTEQSQVLVDWDRVKQRTGGTVGRIEGYSSEKPLVEAPSRTISVEVVLALVENVLTSPPDGGCMAFSETVKSLIGFLEPHNLPMGYFDYLSSRLLQLDNRGIISHPNDLQQWSRTTQYLRELEQANATERLPPNLAYRSVIQHNDFQAGIMHQVLQAFVHADYAEEAVVTFTEMQQMVDSSKMMAIGSFLNSPVEGEAGFFASRPDLGSRDFVDSHGQLPMYKVACFFNMVTDNNLIAMNEWMLYSSDVDGPAIPRGQWKQPSVASALLRYALETGDEVIMRSVIQEYLKWKLKPPVTFLRLVASAHIRLLDFAQAREVLTKLTVAEAGGFHPSNIAHLAATIFRLEARSKDVSASLRQEKLNEALRLMHDLLVGRYNGNMGAFYKSQITLFRQQVGHLLRIFANITESCLSERAPSYMSRYPTANMPNLDVDTFNIVFAALDDFRKGMTTTSLLAQLWALFVQAPESILAIDRLNHHDSTSRRHHLANQDADDDAILTDESTHSSQGALSGSESAEQPPDALFLGDALAYQTASQTGQTPAAPLPPHGVDVISDIVIDNFQDPGRWGQTAGLEIYVRNPAVIANLKTLRILTRSSAGMSLTHLKWARERYKLFGLSESQIDRELRLASQNRDELLVQGMQRDPDSEYARLREKNPVKISKRFERRKAQKKLMAVPIYNIT